MDSSTLFIVGVLNALMTCWTFGKGELQTANGSFSITRYIFHSCNLISHHPLPQFRWFLAVHALRFKSAMSTTCKWRLNGIRHGQGMFKSSFTMQSIELPCFKIQRKFLKSSFIGSYNCEFSIRSVLVLNEALLHCGRSLFLYSLFCNWILFSFFSRLFPFFYFWQILTNAVEKKKNSDTKPFKD